MNHPVHYRRQGQRLRICLVSFMFFLIPSTFGWSQTFTQGNIITLIQTIRNAMPGMNSNKFVIPTNTELSLFESVFTDLKATSYSRISSQVATYGYTFLAFFDTSSGDTLYILEENLPVTRGWGTYIFNPRGTNDVMFECPHPLWDTNAEILGIKAFLRLDARWYSLAGTHRYANPDSSSDVAHKTQTVFHTAHRKIAAPTAIQIHGFDKSNPVYTGYPDVIISNGTLSPPPVLTTVKTKYEAQGFTAGVFSSSTYSSLWRLGATTNTQGQWSNANGKTFVHIEHDYPIRTTDALTAKAVEALYAAFTPASGVDEDTTELPRVFSLEQNYPNPFNPATRIRFTIPTDGYARLIVYNTLGQQVQTAWEGHATAGRYHDVIFDAAGLSTGVYLVRLEHNGASIVRRIIYMK